MFTCFYELQRKALPVEAPVKLRLQCPGEGRRLQANVQHPFLEERWVTRLGGSREGRPREVKEWPEVTQWIQDTDRIRSSEVVPAA